MFNTTKNNKARFTFFTFSLIVIITVVSYSCRDSNNRNQKSDVVKQTSSQLKTSIVENTKEVIPKIDYDTSQWTEVTEQNGVILDIRYATNNNFTENQIYPCPRCFLRPVMADKIINLQKDISLKYGMSLKLFDCYRPRPAQQKLWDIVPDARYVTPPYKGSMHNRGLAVDITLVDSLGQELNMGTEYDFFGPEAYTTNRSLPQKVLKNRQILTKLMDIHGLKGIRTEWWHFSLKTEHAELDDWEWNCD